jgi:hypothetical protein
MATRGESINLLRILSGASVFVLGAPNTNVRVI